MTARGEARLRLLGRRPSDTAPTAAHRGSRYTITRSRALQPRSGPGRPARRFAVQRKARPLRGRCMAAAGGVRISGTGQRVTVFSFASASSSSFTFHRFSPRQPPGSCNPPRPRPATLDRRPSIIGPRPSALHVHRPPPPPPQPTMLQPRSLVLLGAVCSVAAAAAGSLPRGVGPECQSRAPADAIDIARPLPLLTRPRSRVLLCRQGRVHLHHGCLDPPKHGQSQRQHVRLP